MIAPWKTLASRLVHRNRFVRVREDIALMPSGATTVYSVASWGDCVGVLPLVDDAHVIMLRQWRYPHAEGHRLEMPTGGVHPGETPEDAAQRELMEETGFRATALTLVNTHYVAKSVCTDVARLYVGRGLVPAAARPDDTEFMETTVVPLREVVRMVQAGEIRDSMTVVAVLSHALAL